MVIKYIISFIWKEAFVLDIVAFRAYEVISQCILPTKLVNKYFKLKIIFSCHLVLLELFADSFKATGI